MIRTATVSSTPVLFCARCWRRRDGAAASCGGGERFRGERTQPGGSQMKRSLAVLLPLLVACYSPPSTVAATRAGMVVNTSFDRTWTAVIDVFGEKNVPIR